MSQHYNINHQVWDTLTTSDRDGNRTETIISMVLDNTRTVVGAGVAERRPGDTRNQWLGEQLATIRAHRELLMALGRMLAMKAPEYLPFAGFTDDEVKDMTRKVAEYQAAQRAYADAGAAEVLRLWGIPQGTPEGELAWAETQEKDDGD